MNKQQISLSSLLMQIANDQNRPLGLSEFVLLTFQAGYRTDAKSMPNMVMVALQKLAKQEVLLYDAVAGKYTVACPVK